MHINCGYVLIALFIGSLTAYVAAEDINEAYLDDLYPPAIVLNEKPGSDWSTLFQATQGKVSVDRTTLVGLQPTLQFEVGDLSSGQRRATAEAIVPVKPGQLYCYKAVYRTAPPPDDGQLGGYGFMTLHWLGPDGRTLPTRDKLMSRPGAETQWTAREIKALSPPGATHAKLSLVAGWHAPIESSASWFGGIEWSTMQSAPIRLALTPRVLRNEDELLTLRVERSDIPNLTTDGRLIVRIDDAQGNTLRQWVEPILITLPWETTLRLPHGAEGGTVRATIEPVREQAGYTGYEVSEPLLIAHSDLTPRMRNGRFVIDGRPQLILGAYHAEPSDYQALKDAGFNVVMTKHYDAEAAKAEYDELEKLGLYGFAHLGGGGQTLANRARLRGVINTIKDHPALLAWNLMDEPTRKGIGPREIADYGRWVQSLAPHVPTTVNVAGPYQFERFGSASDAFSVDPYPVYFWSGLRKENDPPADLVGVTQWMNQARAATPPSRALIGIVECFTFDAQQQPAATSEELHNMIAQVIASGASAVMVYSVRDTGGWRLREQPQFEALKKINHELLELQDWLVTYPVNNGPGINCDQPDRLVTATWLYNDQPLTVLINVDRKPMAVHVNGEPTTLAPLEVRWIKP